MNTSRYIIGKYNLNKYTRSENTRKKLKNYTRYGSNSDYSIRQQEKELEYIVLNELEKKYFPIEKKVTATYYSKIHPENTLTNTDSNNTIMVKIDLLTKKYSKNTNNKNNQSYLDFYYNIKQNRIEHMALRLKKNLRGKGYARKLVEAVEGVGKKLGCDTIRINVNINKSFWKHMGYELNQSSDEKYWDKKL